MPAKRRGAIGASKMADATVTSLLKRLATGDVDAAWCEFLSLFSPLISHVISRRVLERSQARECYDYVCGALCDEGFRRLLSFRPDGPARFRTWLAAVVANLCSDWRRSERGQVRPPRCVLRLPELEQQVYHCIYERGMSRQRCLEVLQAGFPALTSADIADINARLFRLLTPQQRWQLSVRSARRCPVSCGAPWDDGPETQVPAAEPPLDELVVDQQQVESLRAALARLPVEQRLLLRLRFEQELTLEEIARLTGQPDPFRVHRQLQAALGTLEKLVRDPVPRTGRKN